VIFGRPRPVSSLRINGETGIGPRHRAAGSSNTLDISRNVRAAVAELDEVLPDGVTIRVTSDDATFHRRSLWKVLQTLAKHFDRRGRHLSVSCARGAHDHPGVTVPIALIGTLAMIYLAGFSLTS
jgi:HAE1 family hydrophobic/amphiphilic exporter-1